MKIIIEKFLLIILIISGIKFRNINLILFYFIYFLLLISLYIINWYFNITYKIFLLISIFLQKIQLFNKHSFSDIKKYSIIVYYYYHFLHLLLHYFLVVLHFLRLLHVHYHYHFPVLDPVHPLVLLLLHFFLLNYLHLLH